MISSMPHRTRKPVLAIAMAIACLSATGLPCLTNVARADTAMNMSNRATLTSIDVISESFNETKLRLKFRPQINGFGEISEGGFNRLALGFAQGGRSPTMPMPTNLSGVVRGISFDQLDTVLIMHLDTTGQAKLNTNALDASTVEVTVSRGSGNVRGGMNAEVPGNRPVPLHAPEPIANQTYELVRLQYADVSEVVGLLTQNGSVRANNMFTPREPGFGSSTLSGTGNYPQAPIVGQGNPDDSPLGQTIDDSISIDRRLHAIMLKGTPERVAQMKAQIAIIDVPVESIVLETQLVELTSSGARALGIDLANSSGQIAVGSVQMGQNIPLGLTPNAGSALKSIAVQAAIYAQVQNGEAKVVSRPRISAQNGGTAKIITGDALPILTSIALAGVNGVSQQVQYVNVGVTLQIAPRASADGHVTSQIFCVLSSVSGYSQGYPTISQREAQTSATVMDGESFVIGGLTQESTITNNSKTPLLGDVPVLGRIFNAKRSSKSTSELYIIVTPHIMRASKS